MEDQKGTGSAFEESVRVAFAKAKKDVLNLMNDINRLNSALLDVRQEITSLKQQNSLLSSLIQKGIEMPVLLPHSSKNAFSNNPTVSTGTSSTGNERVLNRPEELLLRQYRLHRQAIARRKLMELIPRTGTISLFDLFSQIVEKEQLCGKTTFYRYVKELSDEKQLQLSLDNGRRMVARSSMEKVL